MSKPLISIVILAGPNREKELFRNIKSIFQSTYKNYEIIVINNSGQPQLLKRVKKNYPQVKTIELIKNTGIYGFNVGMANAVGDYVLAIDDDCALRKDTLQKIVDVYESKSAEVKIITAYVYNPIYNQYYESEKINIINRFSFADGASIYRKKMFDDIGYFDDDFFCWQHSDDLAIRLLNKGYQIHFDKRIIIDHYMVNGGLRKNRAFYDMRNSVWFNLKHFSLIFIPLLFARNMVSLIRLPLRHRSIIAFVYGLIGYLNGWLTMYIPLRKRNVVSFALQQKFIKYYLLNQHPQNK